MPALYRRLLGPAFDRLPPTLRDFHDIEIERHFRAIFRIQRGKGWMRNLLCKLGKLPPAGENVPVRLRVIPEGDRERWVRDFGGHRLESIQWAERGLLVEAIGNARLAFRLHLDGPTLRLETARAWMLGMRLPLALAPGGSGSEVGRADGVAVVVRAVVPLLGQLVQYEGLVLPDPAPSG